MGQTLSHPMTDKVSHSGSDARYLYSVSEMQGWRLKMEDAHAVVLNLDEDKPEGNTFFAVYDGHGGSAVAKFAGENVHKRLVQEPSYEDENFEEALKRAFLGTDEELLANPKHQWDPSGCTAVAGLITTSGRLYVANAGDSRAVISVKGEVIALSEDHKPFNKGERQRITGAGGYIEHGRVNGNLALSRALGDFEFKKNRLLPAEKQIITADPDISVHQITEDDEFFVIACDGIWDCLSSQQVVDYIRYQVSKGLELQDIGENMCDLCLAPDTTGGAGTGCDNMTVLIVALLQGRTKEEWYAWMKDRVQSGYGYKTPETIPSLYSESRMMSFRARSSYWQQKEKEKEPETTKSRGTESPSTRYFLEKMMASYNASTAGITNDPNSLVFRASEDSEEEDSGDEDAYDGRAHFSVGSSTERLRARIEEFENSTHNQSQQVTGMFGRGYNHSDEDEDTDMSDASHGDSGDAQPTKLTNGDARTPTAPVEQLIPLPGGDAASPVTKVEGFLDGSEDPLMG